MSTPVGSIEQHREMDFDRFRLRRFLDNLETAGQLERRNAPTPLSEVAQAIEDHPKAVLFEAVGPEQASLVANVLSDRARIARAFGVSPAALLQEIRQRLRNKPEIVQVSRGQAPVQEIVLTGSDADLTKLPVHLQHGRDGGPYISAAIDFAVDKTTGWTNVGLRRLMLRGRAEAGIDLVAPSDLRAIFQASLKRGERLPLSIVVGSHPIDYFGATMRMPVDELGLLSSLRGAPLPVVKSVTNDIFVPADAEYVLEGYLGEEGYVEPEGPYGEFLGYYGGVKINPIFHLTAITHRKDALFQTLTISGRNMDITDTAQLSALRTEVLVWGALDSAIREPVNVYATPSSGGAFNVRIAIRQRVPGEARNAIAAAFASLANAKNVFIVDPDIDIFSDRQMDWALATRFQANRDLVVADSFRTLPLDPSLPDHSHVGAKAGYDLTLPFGGGESLEARVPEPPRFAGKRFASIRAALEEGPKFFEDLMAAVGSTDGREIVLEIEALRRAGKLQRRTDDGQYMLVP